MSAESDEKGSLYLLLISETGSREYFFLLDQFFLWICRDLAGSSHTFAPNFNVLLYGMGFVRCSPLPDVAPYVIGFPVSWEVQCLSVHKT